ALVSVRRSMLAKGDWFVQDMGVLLDPFNPHGPLPDSVRLRAHPPSKHPFAGAEANCRKALRLGPLCSVLLAGSLGAQSVYTPYTFTTLAGLAGSYGSADGTGSAARFRVPFGVATDSSGNVYVADTDNYTIRKGFLPPPELTISLSGDPPSGIVVTWPTNAAGFTLQSTTTWFQPWSGAPIPPRRLSSPARTPSPTPSPARSSF